MNVIITPHTLQGTVEAPSSKSIGHRDLICAALAGVVAIAIAAPLLRRQRAGAEPAAAFDLRVYRDQLREVEDLYRSLSRELTLEEWKQQPLRSTVLDNLARLTSSLQ